ncbi:MAG: tail fiber protein [bacterium]|nr:tail fiber protein [bacterium]
MKNLFNSAVFTLMAAIIAFSGCEAGLSQQSDSSDDGQNFSFSDMYSKFAAMQERINTLELQNQSLESQNQSLGGSINDLMAPVGSIVAWHKNFGSGATIPAGWIECDGSIINDGQSIYNGETVPDLNSSGRFMRGGAISGVLQNDATDVNGLYMNSTGSHSHSFSYTSANFDGYGGGGNRGRADEAAAIGGSTGSAGNHEHTMYSDDSETRPTNMSVIWIIRIK